MGDLHWSMYIHGHNMRHSLGYNHLFKNLPRRQIKKLFDHSFTRTGLKRTQKVKKSFVKVGYQRMESESKLVCVLFMGMVTLEPFCLKVLGETGSRGSSTPSTVDAIKNWQKSIPKNSSETCNNPSSTDSAFECLNFLSKWLYCSQIHAKLLLTAATCINQRRSLSSFSYVLYKTID
ncbi:uncharacterized protein LOC111907802 isoform X3 [Lactuca sativa]|nr:uncharacterized protein LOC111907802 isoform X3 [Lactuca sativa]